MFFFNFKFFTKIFTIVGLLMTKASRGACFFFGSPKKITNDENDETIPFENLFLDKIKKF